MMTKREFLKKILLPGSGILFGSWALSSQARALEVLKRAPAPTANDLQQRLLNEPERRTLLTEIAECVAQPGLPRPEKLKCLGMYG